MTDINQWHRWGMVIQIVIQKLRNGWCGRVSPLSPLSPLEVGHMICLVLPPYIGATTFHTQHTIRSTMGSDTQKALRLR